MLERLSQDSIVDALAEVPHDFRDVLVLVDIGEFSLRRRGADPRHPDGDCDVALAPWAGVSSRRTSPTSYNTTYVDILP